MPTDLAVGDVVRLKTGGPKMTVHVVGSTLIRCVWFAETGEPGKEWEGPITAEFPPFTLVKAEA